MAERPGHGQWRARSPAAGRKDRTGQEQYDEATEFLFPQSHRGLSKQGLNQPGRPRSVSKVVRGLGRIRTLAQGQAIEMAGPITPDHFLGKGRKT